MNRRGFRKNEVMATQDAAPESLMIVRSGVATVTRHDNGKDIELGRLAPGDFLAKAGF